MSSHEESLEDQVRRMVIAGHGKPPGSQFNRDPQQHGQSLGSVPNGRAQFEPPHLRQRVAHPGPKHEPHGRGNGHGSGSYRQPAQPRQYQEQQPPMDPHAFHRGGQVAGYYQQPRQQPRQLYDPNMRRGLPMNTWNDVSRQAEYLDHLATSKISKVDMTQAEAVEKEAFRATLESLIHDLCATDDRLPGVSLECFGSFRSGFATAGSDMDLVIVLQDGTPYTTCFSLLEDDLPRALEKHLLKMGYGARLLTRTRVPIIKICEKPNDCLLSKLRDERYKWEILPNEKKYPHLHQNEDEEALAGESTEADAEPTPVDTGSGVEQATGNPSSDGRRFSQSGTTTADADIARDAAVMEASGATSNETASRDNAQKPQQRKRDNKPFTRERKAGPLDFPKDGVGIQCDINFFNPLGLHNTQLLRCYSLCDPRVRPMVLFVKAWAKRRKINSSYSGTLSSYGYVLMVLHYLVNVAQPPVLPNLQTPWRPNQYCTPPGAARTEIDEHVVDFWRNESEIMQAVRNGQMSSNRESVGSLLNDFFRYFSSQGGYPQFHWMQDVLSLRTPGGLLRKDEKGWTKAVTEDGEGKRVQHRYLFCIEDPFETSHNVARTVTHQGIVAIRDEFRRAFRILRAVGQAQPHEDLFAHLLEADHFEKATAELKLDGVTAAQATDALMKVQQRLASNQSAFAQNRGGSQRGNHGHRGRGRGRGGVESQQRSQAPPPINNADQDAFPAIGSSPAPRRQPDLPANISTGGTRSTTNRGSRRGRIAMTGGAQLEQVQQPPNTADADAFPTLR